MTEASEFEHLAASLESALKTFERDREAQEKRTEASVRKMERIRKATAVGIVVGLIAIPIGIAGVYAAHEANQAVSDMKAQRVTSRVTNCVTSNAGMDALSKVVHRAATPPPGVTLTPDQQKRADAFVADTKPLIDKGRVNGGRCSPKELEHYYSTTTTEKP